MLSWEGHLRPGVAGEAPAHLAATEAAFGSLWKGGFALHVAELPEVVEIRLDWTAASPAEVMFMVHLPYDESRPHDWVEYENPTRHMQQVRWPTEGPLCMRIPTDEVAPGHWHVMAHSRYGADVALAFTVTTVGGEATIPEGVHGHEATPQEAGQLVEMADEDVREWLPCEFP